jgi:hypothetical protein
MNMHITHTVKLQKELCYIYQLIRSQKLRAHAEATNEGATLHLAASKTAEGLMPIVAPHRTSTQGC